MFRALVRSLKRETPSAEIIDLAAERRLRDQAQAAVTAIDNFRAGRAPHTAVLAALVAPFAGG